MKPEGAEEASKPMHLARFAIAHFDGLTEEDRGQLIEEARNGDETAGEELEAATTAELERVRDILSDGESMDVLELGITLGAMYQSSDKTKSMEYQPTYGDNPTLGILVTQDDMQDGDWVPTVNGLVVIVALEEQINQFNGTIRRIMGIEDRD